MRNWVVDLDPKVADKKLANYIIFEESKQQIDAPYEPMSKRASRIISRKSIS